MDKKHKGALSELLATTWLLEQGLEVFRNVSQHGVADLVTFDPKTGLFEGIDVTSGYWTTKGALIFPTKPVIAGVRVLVVVPVGAGVEFLWAPPPKAKRIFNCAECGKEATSKWENAKFCSTLCGSRASNRRHRALKA